MEDVQQSTMRDAMFLPAALGQWGGALTDALNEVPYVSAYFKDNERRFVWCSEALARLAGVDAEDDVLGLRDEDLAPADLAADYRTHEEEVLRDGRRLTGLIELVRRGDGSSIWYLSTKTPVRAPDGSIIGLAGVNRPLTRKSIPTDRSDPMLQVATYISTHIHRRITIADMADSVSMSPSHFSRSFKKRFDATPHQYLRGFRIAAASDLLVTTTRSLAAIASVTGYADQSHFSNEFTRFRAMTPTEYRRGFTSAK
jgi:PAS domain S-box-containing protein